MTDRFRLGDYNIIDDRTGFKIKRSEARQEWNGLIVSKQVFEHRQPQDFVRGREDKQSVPQPRSEGVDQTVGPLATEINASHTAGSTSLTVLSSTGFSTNDVVAIMLDNGDRHRTIISSVTDETTIVITAALPWSTSAGLAVVNYTAGTEADIG